MKRFNFTAKCDFINQKQPRGGRGCFDCHILAQLVSHLLVSEPVESGVVGAGGAVGGGIHANGAAGKAAGYLGAQKAQVNILGNAGGFALAFFAGNT